MKILVVSQYFYPENFRINDLCLGLKEQGHSVSVLTAKPNYPTGIFFKGYSFFNKSLDNYNGIKLYRTPIIPRGNGFGIRLFINYISFVIFGIIRLLSINEKFDRVLVYAPSPITVGYIGAFAAFKSRAKSYLWVHDLWPESVKDAGGINNKLILYLIDLMTKSIYSFYKIILVQSPYFKKYLNEQSVKESKIVYYPYYAENFYNIKTPNKDIKTLFGSGINIVFAGNIGVAQSFDTIIDAALILKNQISDFKFIIIGDGRDKKRVENKILKLSLSRHFQFLGSHPPEKMPDFFACADALLVSLKNTKIFSMTIPGKLQSYLACGRPIIGSLSGIGADIINESKSGYTADAENPKELADCVLTLSKLNDLEKKDLGMNGRTYYEREFKRDLLIKKLIKILNQ